MHESGWVCEQRACAEGMKDMTAALHDLCQPLTTLQCRLEIAEVVGTEQGYREAVSLGLKECSRMIDAVAVMREVIHAAQREAELEALGPTVAQAG